MISEETFVAVRQFDRTLAASTDAGQRIINAKNRDLVRLQGVIAELTRQLNAERSARKIAELKLMRRH